MPARVKTAPRPALKRGLFSSLVTVEVATSRAVAPGFDRAWEEDWRMESRAERYWCHWEAGRLERVMLPQPPWMIIRGFVGRGFSEEGDIVDD